MSATATTAIGRPAAAEKTSGWKHLAGLLPYLGRYWGKITIGIVTLLAMGLVGNLPPLLMGAIIDSISGKNAPQAMGRTLVRPFVAFLLPYYHASSRQTLVIFCAALVGLVVVKGILSFWTRWVLIGVSRDIE